MALLHRLCSAEGPMEASWLSILPLALLWCLAFWLQARCQVCCVCVWAGFHLWQLLCRPRWLHFSYVALLLCRDYCVMDHRSDSSSAHKSALTFSLSSGGHLNPAVTFAMCFLAREPWIKLPVYALAQTLGAFLGAGIVFGLYHGRCGKCVWCAQVYTI